MCPYSEICGVLDCNFQFTILSPLSFDGPSFDALWACVSLYISFHVHVVPDVLPRSPCGWRQVLAPAEGGTESPDCEVRIPVSHDRCFFPFLSFLYLKLFEFGVEVAFYNGSAVTHHKVNLLKFPRRTSCFERTDDAFVLLIRFCFFHLWELLVPVCRLFEF